MRLIRSGPLSPALNLALDEALLRSGTETFRLYAWDPPALSLGYFQTARGWRVPEGFDLVRRPTGGGAIAHTGELTLSWVGRKQRVDAAYATINRLVTAALARLGVEVTEGAGEPVAAPHGLCFDHHTRYDLLTHEKRKIFGSAQRRGGDRFLLHGTLVLTPNPMAKGAVSVAEALGRPLERQIVENALIHAAPWAFATAQPSPDEWVAANTLAQSRYTAAAWTQRR